MQHTLKSIFNSFGVLLFAFNLLACAHSFEREQAKPVTEQVFAYPFDQVWRAAQLSIRYPLAMNNMDTGSLETEWIPTDEGWRNVDPANTIKVAHGSRYQLILKITKGDMKKKPAVKIVVSKKIQKATDFFSDPDLLISDGYEERTILYRIERELQIEEGIKKAQAAGKL